MMDTAGFVLTGVFAFCWAVTLRLLLFERRTVSDLLDQRWLRAGELSMARDQIRTLDADNLDLRERLARALAMVKANDRLMREFREQAREMGPGRASDLARGAALMASMRRAREEAEPDTK